MSVLSRLLAIPHKYPVIRGMVAYAVLWPLSSVIQQTFENGNTRAPIDWLQVFRYGLFGSCSVAPTLFLWMRFSSRMFPGNDLGTAIKKALIEQLTYGPSATVWFYFGMSALEMKSVQECVDEVKLKILPTLKVAVCIWPVVQTCNFYFIPEKNRVVFLSLISLLWTCFLAHMKSLDKQRIEAQRAEKENLC